MKFFNKYIVLLITPLFLFPLGTYAQLQQFQINSILELLASFEVDQVVMKEVEVILKTGMATGSTSSKNNESCKNYIFNANLSFGDSSEDVKELQIILNIDTETQVATNGVGSLENETEYFGNLTRSAVITFQNKYAEKILTPIGLQKGTGFVGIKTREFLNSMSKCEIKIVETENTDKDTIDIHDDINDTSSVSVSDISDIPETFNTIRYFSSAPSVIDDPDIIDDILPTPDATNTVMLHSSFETGINDWKAEEGYSLSDDTASDGLYSIKGVNIGWRNFFMRVPFACMPNTDYIFKFDYNITNNPNNNRVLFMVAKGSNMWAGGLLAKKEVNGTSTEWMEETVAFNSGSESSCVIRINGGSLDQTIYFDNFRIEQNGTSTRQTVYATDAHQKRLYKEQSIFFAWLNGEKGMIGEFGVPKDTDSDKYIDAVEFFFSLANAYKFDTTPWALGAWWPSDYPLQPYDWNDNLLVDNAISQPFKDNVTTPEYFRGMSLVGGEFGLDSNANGKIGPIGTAYMYHRNSSIWQEMKNKNITHARFAFRLERLFDSQGNFDTTDKQYFETAMDKAHSAGMKVILDPHNYGSVQFDGLKQVLTDTGVFSQAVYNKMMGGLAELAMDKPSVVGMCLMNEPKEISKDDWERYSQGAVDAIRAKGFNGTIFIPTWNWQGIQDVQAHSAPWIQDEGDHVYEVHQYIDPNHSGTYKNTYAIDEETIAGYGYSAGNCILQGS